MNLPIFHSILRLEHAIANRKKREFMMKTLIMHRKITLSIFVMIMLLCGLGGVSYAQVCKVGDVLFPFQGCSDPSVGYFSVLADGSASIGGATLNAANIHWNAFSAKNLGNAWGNNGRSRAELRRSRPAPKCLSLTLMPHRYTGQILARTKSSVRT